MAVEETKEVGSRIIKKLITKKKARTNLTENRNTVGFISMVRSPENGVSCRSRRDDSCIASTPRI